MDEQGVEMFRELLLKKEKDIEHTIGLMKENNSAEQDKYSPAELSNYDNHPAEIGTELFQAEFNNALKVHEEHILKEIRDALERIDKGTYGKCAFCGEEIDIERLKAIPYADLCIDCEKNRKLKPEIVARTRPNEEEVLDAPFGRKYLNEQEDDEHDGMDVLNDLMKYGSADSPQDMGGYHDYEEFYTNKVDEQGIVDKMDKVTNKEYKEQLPD